MWLIYATDVVRIHATDVATTKVVNQPRHTLYRTKKQHFVCFAVLLFYCPVWVAAKAFQYHVCHQA
jgi:hypothetical protein